MHQNGTRKDLLCNILLLLERRFSRCSIPHSGQRFERVRAYLIILSHTAFFIAEDLHTIEDCAMKGRTIEDRAMKGRMTQGV